MSPTKRNDSMTNIKSQTSKPTPKAGTSKGDLPPGKTKLGGNDQDPYYKERQGKGYQERHDPNLSQKAIVNSKVFDAREQDLEKPKLEKQRQQEIKQKRKERGPDTFKPYNEQFKSMQPVKKTEDPMFHASSGTPVYFAGRPQRKGTNEVKLQGKHGKHDSKGRSSGDPSKRISNQDSRVVSESRQSAKHAALNDALGKKKNRSNSVLVIDEGSASRRQIPVVDNPRTLGKSLDFRANQGIDSLQPQREWEDAIAEDRKNKKPNYKDQTRADEIIQIKKAKKKNG